MQQKKNTLLVIIVTYNAMQWAERCFDSIYKSSLIPDIYVIDNGSTDGTQAFIQDHYQDVIFFQSDRNLGFGKANNIGLQYAIDHEYDYVYLLNQDAWVSKCVFEKLAKLLEEHCDYGILSPIQMSGNKDKIGNLFLKQSICETPTQELLNDYILGQEVKDIYPTSFVMAAHWIIRVSCLRNVGLFSDAFPHYGEDNNLIHRMEYKGFHTGICPKIFAFHDNDNRNATSSKQLYRLYIRSIVVSHNILENKKTRRGKIIKIIVKILCLQNVSIWEKANTVYKIIKVIKSAPKYRDMYKSMPAC